MLPSPKWEALSRSRHAGQVEQGTAGWERVLPTLGRGPLTCTAAGATATPDPPGLPSGCRSRYRAQSPTLGRRTRAARASATACRSRFSLRLIGAGPPRRAPPRLPRLCASARPSARRRQQFGQQKRPRRRPRSNSAALPLLAGGGAGRLHRVAAAGVRSNPAIPRQLIPSPAPRLPPRRARFGLICLHPSVLHLLTGDISPPGCTGSCLLSAPPRGTQWCVPLLRLSPPAAALLKSRSWGVGRSLGPLGARSGTPPGTHAALRSPREPRGCEDKMQPITLGRCILLSSQRCPETGRQDPPLTWRLRATCMQRAAGTVRIAQQAALFPSSFSASCAVLSALSPVWALCKTNEETRASLRDLFSCTSNPVDLDCFPVPSVLLDTVPRTLPETSCRFFFPIQTTSERPRWARHWARSRE